ncbi:hypothetical protein IscW_ISCW004604, partial [Ixodes scapularis]
TPFTGQQATKKIPSTCAPAPCSNPKRAAGVDPTHNAATAASAGNATTADAAGNTNETTTNVAIPLTGDSKGHST